MSLDKLEPVVTRCFLSILEQRGVEAPATVNRETLVFGVGGVLDSMGIVTMIVDVEQAVHDEFGQAVSLADDRAMSQRNSPYRSIGSLADYIAAQLNGAA